MVNEAGAFILNLLDLTWRFKPVTPQTLSNQLPLYYPALCTTEPNYLKFWNKARLSLIALENCSVPAE